MMMMMVVVMMTITIGGRGEREGGHVAPTMSPLALPEGYCPRDEGL